MFKAFKVVGGLPGTLEPDAIYLVRVGLGFDLYVTDATGVNAHKVNSGAADLTDLPVLMAAPTRPEENKAALYPHRRGGYDFLDFYRHDGSPLSLQPHIGRQRVGSWLPNGAGLGNIGINAASAGTISAPTCSASSLASSMLRARIKSAATAGSNAVYRATHLNLWRGNRPNLGGFLFMARVSLSLLAVGANGFFGLTSSPNSITVFDVATWGGQFIGLAFKEGVHSNWQLARRDNVGPAVFTDLGVPLTDLEAVLTLYVYSEPNGDSLYVRVVNEATGAAQEFEFTTAIPLPNSFLAPRLHMDNAAATTAVEFDVYGVYVESDY